MSIKRWDAKRDANEREIIDALKGVGCTVEQLDIFDLAVGRVMPDGERRNFLLEVKMPNKRDDLKDSQVKLRDTWRGQYTIVTSVVEAFEACKLPVVYWSQGVDVLDWKPQSYISFDQTLGESK
jgi:hypothetical protein